MRRLVAVLVAVGLVVIAVIIRNGIDNGGGKAGDGGGKPRLVCAPELEPVCDALGSDVAVTIEDPGTTATRLENAGAHLGIDGWLTPGPWAQMVVEARTRDQNPPLLTVGRPLARSSIGLAFWPDRLGAASRFCKGEPTWKCVGDLAGTGAWGAAGGPADWGRIKIGLSDPVNDATGLAALGAATVGYFGRDPATLSSTDIDDAGFRTWLRGLANAHADHPDLSDVLARGPAEAAATATFEAVGTRLIAASASKPKLTYPAPVASADVVLGTASTDGGQRLAELLTPERLVKAGWEAVRSSPTGLPSPGFLAALQGAWKEAAQ